MRLLKKRDPTVSLTLFMIVVEDELCIQQINIGRMGKSFFWHC